MRSNELVPSRRIVLVAALFILSSLGLALSSQSRAAELAYLGHRSGDSYLVVTSEHGNERRILDHDYTHMYYNGGPMALSPNGRRVAYCKNFLISFPEPHWEERIVVTDVNENKTIFQTFEEEVFCNSLDFSPDGSHLLYSVAGGETETDIWEMAVDESSEPREVVGWNGRQIYAHYTPDGEHIVFSSDSNAEGEIFEGEEEGPPGEWNLFSTTLEGELAIDITQSSPLWTEAGVDYALAPDVSVSSAEAIVFECGYQEFETITWHLCRINRGGTGSADLGVEGFEPSWSTDGESIVYSLGIEEGMEMSSTGEGSKALPLDVINGNEYTVSNAVTRQSATTLDNIARNFRPAIRIDEADNWRPAELEELLDEQGAQICIGEICELVFSLEELGEYSGEHPEEAVLDLPPVGGYWEEEPNFSDPDNYGADDCTPSIFASAVDCEDQKHDAIYYDTSHISPGGYRFLEYWFFYRFNDSPVDEVPFFADNFDHEADWETISVGVPNEALPKTFDFVVFAQHEDSWAYMRENLSCEEEGESCEANAKHVNVFAADGTHASYAGECEATLFIPCRQQNELYPENDHGGEIHWIGNRDAGLMQPLPPTYSGEWLAGPMSFTDWPGKWGLNEDLEGVVDSPANQPTFYEPWDAECSTEPCEREEPEEEPRSALRQEELSEDVEVTSMPSGCRSWFGPEVSAALCSEARLDDSLAKAAIGRREGSADLVKVDGRRRGHAATTGGLAQLGGDPLAPGDKLLISGDVGTGAVLLVRTSNGQKMTVTSYALESSAAKPSVIRVTQQPDPRGDGMITVPVARSSDGTIVDPQSLSAETLPR